MLKKIVCIGALTSLFLSCDMMSDGGGKFRGENFSVSASSRLVGDFTHNDVGLHKSGGKTSTLDLDTIIDSQYYITPINIIGKAVSLAMRIGGREGEYVDMILFAPEEQGFSGSSLRSSDNFLVDFDLKNPYSGQTRDATVLIRDNPYPDSANAMMSSVDILFSWIDFTFTMPQKDDSTPQDAVVLNSHSDIPDTHTVRVVYADVTDKGYKRGDLLYFDPADSLFKWVDKDVNSQQATTYQSFLTTTRPANPVFDDHIFLGDGTYIPSVEITVPRDSMKVLPRELLEQFGWQFTITFSVKNSISLGEAKYIDLAHSYHGLDLKTMMSFFGTRFGGENSLSSRIHAEIIDSTGMEIPDYTDSTSQDTLAGE